MQAVYLAIAGGGGRINFVSLGPLVRTRRELASVNRMIALGLAVIWLCAGIGAIVLGFMQVRWLVVVLGLFALWYALLWLRVVSRRRLLTWAELVVPWAGYFRFVKRRIPFPKSRRTRHGNRPGGTEEH